MQSHLWQFSIHESMNDQPHLFTINNPLVASMASKPGVFEGWWASSPRSFPASQTRQCYSGLVKSRSGAYCCSNSFYYMAALRGPLRKTRYASLLLFLDLRRAWRVSISGVLAAHVTSGRACCTKKCTRWSSVQKKLFLMRLCGDS